MSTEDTDNGHHILPAVRDWPQGYGEASWWPFVTAVGLAITYLGATMYTVGLPSSGVWVFVVGALASGVGMLGWIYQAFVVDYWGHPSHDGGESLRIGMLLFLVSDVGTFGAGFVYYFFVRVGAWKTGYLPTSGLLSGVLVANTVALVLSSLVLRWAEGQLEQRNHQQFVAGIVATFVLGAGFVAGQVYEYYDFIVRDGFSLASGVFASGFFGLTGLHGLHIVLGVILLAILAIRGFRGQYDADHRISVTTVSWYWHFLAASWLFFVAVIYIGSTFGTAFSPF